MLNTAMATYKAIKTDDAHDTLRNDDNLRSVIIFLLGQVPFLSCLAVLSKKINRMKSPTMKSSRESRRKCVMKMARDVIHDVWNESCMGIATWRGRPFL